MKKLLTLVFLIFIMAFIAACSSTVNSNKQTPDKKPIATNSQATTGNSTESSDKKDKEFEVKFDNIKDICNSNYNISSISKNSITVGDLTDVPKIYSGAKAYGYFESSEFKQDKGFSDLTFSSEIKNPSNCTISLSVRTGSGESNWSEWTDADVADGEVTISCNGDRFQFRYMIVVGKDEQAPIIKLNSIKG